MTIDFNELERAAQTLIDHERFSDALAIFFFMADGDPSLDAGYLGARIGECYERAGEYPAARYWYGRALEENPVVRRDCQVAIDRLPQADGAELIARATGLGPR